MGELTQQERSRLQRLFVGLREIGLRVGKAEKYLGRMPNGAGHQHISAAWKRVRDGVARRKLLAEKRIELRERLNLEAKLRAEGR